MEVVRERGSQVMPVAHMVTRKPDRWGCTLQMQLSGGLLHTGLASKDKVTTVCIGGLGSEKPRRMHPRRRNCGMKRAFRNP